MFGDCIWCVGSGSGSISFLCGGSYLFNTLHCYQHHLHNHNPHHHNQLPHHLHQTIHLTMALLVVIVACFGLDDGGDGGLFVLM